MIQYNSRYGFIITEKELVVLRVSMDPKDQTSVQLVEVRSVPWRHNLANGMCMTVNLALWWLHMLALRDHSIQRSYTALVQTLKLNRKKRELDAVHGCGHVDIKSAGRKRKRPKDDEKRKPLYKGHERI